LSNPFATCGEWIFFHIFQKCYALDKLMIKKNYSHFYIKNLKLRKLKERKYLFVIFMKSNL
jgi:hypothetical protein